MPSSNPLRRFVETTRGRQIRKYEHYYDVYHRHLSKFRGRKIVVVEFGVHMGGSAQMWREYFGADVMIYGIDITPECKRWETPWFKVFVGDQSDRAFLAEIAAEIGPIDVLIEDGGHRPEQQIATFEIFYPKVKPGGVFLIEDLHTSYWPSYDGGYQRPGTFMEYAKPLTDQLNAFHSREPRFAVDRFTRSTTSMHFYDSIVVFEKARVDKPRRLDGGRPGWERRPDTDVLLSRRSLLRTEAVRAGRRAAPLVRRALRRARALGIRGRD
ncbi:class I SAM-dependent methyltransferase [uncultured Friedmanniella sp.]|uniref:class I SAM-dependent methyltransferase n=1 Tax=uncultured Friedmanniella sp. TaxID=335381 RepID=UPI0035CBB367